MPILLPLLLSVGLLHPTWVSADWRQSGTPVTTRIDAPLPEQIISTAEGFLGVPYSWGGTGGGGFDCSGFINKVFAINGYDLPRVSREQVHIGLEVSPLDLQTGDLLFFDSDPGSSRITHVGIYVRDKTFIHAASGKGEVTYDRLSEHYFESRFVAARRVLVLPPGRYSTLQGGAAAGVTFASMQQVGEYLERQKQVPTPMRATFYAPQAPRSGSAPGVETLLSEHGEEGRPLQLAAAAKRGAIVEVGPALLIDDATRVGLRFGGGRMDGETVLFFMPEFSYFGQENALQLDFAAPLQIRTDGGQSVQDNFAQSWSTARDFSKVLRGASFGQKEANVFVSFGRTTSETLGDGQAMRYFTPNVASRTLPPTLIVPNALSLVVDLNSHAGGGSIFVDDLLVPRIIGLNGYMRPADWLATSDEFLRALTLGVTYAADYGAPLSVGDLTTRSVHAVSATVDAKLIDHPQHMVKTYLDVTTLVRPEGAGVGGTLGLAWHAALGAAHGQALRLRAEGRVSTPGYLPSYFDLTYALDRSATPVGDGAGTVMSKLAWLDTLAQQAGRIGFYTELTYQPHRRASMGLSYEDGRAFGDVPANLQYPSRNLMFFAQFKNIYLTDGGAALHMHVAYDLRHFEALSPFLSGTRGNEYAFAALTLDLTPGVQFNGSIRKALNPSNTQSAAIDGVLDVAFHYEL